MTGVNAQDVIYQLIGKRAYGPRGMSFEQEVLAEVGLLRVPRIYRGYVVSMGLLSAVSIVIALNATDPDNIFKTAAVLTAFGTFLLGYMQWRAARHEVSFDKYYDRLHLANEKFNSWRTTFFECEKEEKLSHLHTMFIFYELDILEYVLGKLQLGYVDQELAERAIRAFRARCGDQKFREAVLHWVGTTERYAKAEGYEKTTRRAARFIINYKMLVEPAEETSQRALARRLRCSEELKRELKA